MKQLLFRIERSQLRYYGHVMRMSKFRHERQILEVRSTGKILKGRSRTRWMDNIQKLGWPGLGHHTIFKFLGGGVEGDMD